MWLRLAALAAFAIAPCVYAQAPSPAVSSDSLTLDDAIARVARVHPDLRLIDARRGDSEVSARDIGQQVQALRLALQGERVDAGLGQRAPRIQLAAALQHAGQRQRRFGLAESTRLAAAEGVLDLQPGTDITR